jgi:ribosomal-protein-alanine N-acetyltransferase
MSKIDFSPFPELKTNRLKLHRLGKKDIDNIFAIRSNEAIAKYLDRPLYKSIEEAAAFINKINRGIDNNDWIYWAITLKQENSFIGTICLWNFSEDKTGTEIGFELLPVWQGKGLMTEAVAEVVKYGFNNLRLKFIDGEVAPDNARSISLMKKFNFQLLADAKRDSVTVIYRLSRDLYSEIQDKRF